ncbi:hypothetical protein LA080_002780 [Diaporthe eres]|nr:hypothetical protein LA080_002780 [Diaporthe eres]
MASRIPLGFTRLQVSGEDPHVHTDGGYRQRRHGQVRGDAGQSAGHSIMEIMFFQQEQIKSSVVGVRVSRRAFFGGGKRDPPTADAQMPHCGLHLHGQHPTSPPGLLLSLPPQRKTHEWQTILEPDMDITHCCSRDTGLEPSLTDTKPNERRPSDRGPDGKQPVSGRTADHADRHTIYITQIWRYRVTRARSTRSLPWNLCSISSYLSYLVASDSYTSDYP